MIDDYESIRNAIDTSNALTSEQYDIACSATHEHDPEKCAADTETPADTEVPEDLIALELTRRARKTEHDAYLAAHPDHGGCRHQLYLAETAVAKHPWIVERKADWRTARKTLKQAANNAVTS